MKLIRIRADDEGFFIIRRVKSPRPTPLHVRELADFVDGPREQTSVLPGSSETVIFPRPSAQPIVTFPELFFFAVAVHGVSTPPPLRAPHHLDVPTVALGCNSAAWPVGALDASAVAIATTVTDLRMLPPWIKLRSSARRTEQGVSRQAPISVHV